MDELSTIIITAIITGGMTAIFTIGGIRVHIDYLRSGLDKNEKATARAHSRIDEVQKDINIIVQSPAKN